MKLINRSNAEMLGSHVRSFLVIFVPLSGWDPFTLVIQLPAPENSNGPIGSWSQDHCSYGDPKITGSSLVLCEVLLGNTKFTPTKQMTSQRGDFAPLTGKSLLAYFNFIAANKRHWGFPNKALVVPHSWIFTCMQRAMSKIVPSPSLNNTNG